ncbi:hypothetical protein BGX30_007608 [Mortierella sp. GBA39]|nr:hypothetical protein BGX30_007608 [Mortierella sp. GBA39]
MDNNLRYGNYRQDFAGGNVYMNTGGARQSGFEVDFEIVECKSICGNKLCERGSIPEGMSDLWKRMREIWEEETPMGLSQFDSE